jgi:hypothetical protein
MADPSEEKFRTILADCPVGPGDHEDDIEVFAKRLAEIRLSKDALNRRLGTKKRVETDLRRLRFTARKMIGDFHNMPVEALAAMALVGDDRAIRRIYEVLFEIAWRAEDGIAKNPGSKSKQGRSRNYQAMGATACSAHAWHKLTGKRATPGHKDRGTGERTPFEQFLGKVFAAMNIRANPEHYARDMRGGGWEKILEERLPHRADS